MIGHLVKREKERKIKESKKAFTPKCRFCDTAHDLKYRRIGDKVLITCKKHSVEIGEEIK
jgi:hypothetical protein